MVQKIIWISLLSFSVQAATPDLHLQWAGSKDKPCQLLIETFLIELRSLAADRVVELETEGAAPIKIRCIGNDVEVADEKEKFLLHYQAKASGFDANDWLPFQRKYLRPDLSLSATLKAAPEPTAMLITAPPASKESSSILQRWWFWAIVGGVGASVYGIVRASERRSSSVNVEIH